MKMVNSYLLDFKLYVKETRNTDVSLSKSKTS